MNFCLLDKSLQCKWFVNWGDDCNKYEDMNKNYEFFCFV